MNAPEPSTETTTLTFELPVPMSDRVQQYARDNGIRGRGPAIRFALAQLFAILDRLGDGAAIPAVRDIGLAETTPTD